MGITSWHDMSGHPTDGETIEMDVDGTMITGWCSTKFLRGTPTYWGRVEPNGAACIVHPSRWRYVECTIPTR